MQKSQGVSPVEDSSLFEMENSNQNSLVQSRITPDQSELVRLKNIRNRDSLEKSIMLSCEQCTGALVSIATCPVCKKSSMRKCAQCNIQIISDNHDSCKKLIVFVKFSSTNSKNKQGGKC